MSGGGAGGVPAGALAVGAPWAISVGPQDTAVWQATAEESSAGAPHLTASQPRTPPTPH